MQNNNMDNILNKRRFEDTNLEALNTKILELAKKTPQAEFTSTKVRVNNSVKIIAIVACFVVGIFTGFKQEVSAISNDFIDYVYIEEGIV